MRDVLSYNYTKLSGWMLWERYFSVRESSNASDSYAVAVKKDGTIIGFRKAFF